MPNTKTSPSVAEVIAEELAAAGVDRVFGLPGGEVLFLIDAMRRHGIEFSPCRHESNAGMMAAVYGKLKGTTGVVLTTLGPGAANLLLPISNSLLDREPLLAITADIPTSWPLSHTHQRLPLREIFGPIAKYTSPVNGFNARQAVREAISHTLTEPAGPSLLTLSAEAAVSRSYEPQSPQTSRDIVRARVAGDAEAAAEQITAQLAEAERPLVLLGCGARSANAELLRAWIESWRLPVVVTPKVKGIVDETGPNFVGVVGGMSIDNLMLSAIRGADLLIGFGFDPVEVDKTWHAELPILWVLESPQVGGIVPSENLVVIDHAAVLKRLSDRSAPKRWPNAYAEVQHERQAIAEADGHGESGTVYPTAIVQALAEVAPAETIVATDVGSHKYLFGQFWPSRVPDSFFMSNGLSGMGYGLPVAIGAKLARSHVPVIAVLGDGGFSMNSQELETARRLGAEIIVVVLADSSYSLIRQAQQSRGLPRYGVDFSPIDSVTTARACGFEARRTSNADQLATAVGQAIEQRSGLLVEVPVDPDAWKGLV